MKFIRIFSCLLLTLIFVLGSKVKAQDHRNCGTMSHHQKQLLKDTTLYLKMQLCEEKISELIKNAKPRKKIYRIPVVFHVLWSLPMHNISDAQIFSQLDVLNQDYRRLNSDASNTPSEFKDVVADTEIEFCLAHIDPQGNWTDGITRKNTSKAVFDLGMDDAKFDTEGGVNAWDTKKYLNIWIVPALKDGSFSGVMGYSQFPGGDTLTDGVVICHKYFGTLGTAKEPFNKGRTTTHEVGHWLNLLHIWGDDNGACWGDDRVDDTPNQEDSHVGCPSQSKKTCDGKSDMFMNYMDYTDDRCMNLFTKGQAVRMQATLNSIRSELVKSGICQPVSLNDNYKDLKFLAYPNPVSDEMVMIWDFINYLSPINISIYNMKGEEVFFKSPKSKKGLLKINTLNFSNGLYLVKISNGLNTYSKKIIVQH